MRARKGVMMMNRFECGAMSLDVPLHGSGKRPHRVWTCGHVDTKTPGGQGICAHIRQNRSVCLLCAQTRKMLVDIGNNIN